MTKQAISATIRHHGETWKARLLDTLSGEDRDGRPLRSGATVLLIDPDGLRLINDGRGGAWDPYAQVHGMTDVVWVDYEHEDVENDKKAGAIAARAEVGWTFYKSLELVDTPESERLFFTRPWSEPTTLPPGEAETRAEAPEEHPVEPSPQPRSEQMSTTP